MQDFGTLRQPLLGELAMSWREEREKEETKMHIKIYCKTSDCQNLNIAILLVCWSASAYPPNPFWGLKRQ